MKNIKFKINDFVIITERFENIEKNAVAIILEILEEKIIVFFIGKKIKIEIQENKIQFLDVEKTGKSYSYKICNVCHILKDINEFDINQTDAKGNKTTRPSCKNCRIEIDGIALNTEDSKKMEQEKPKLLFICPICEKTSIAGITASIVKDHNHHTGKGRAWLCDSCNTGLGRFKDDVDLLKKAIDYLEKHS